LLHLQKKDWFFGFYDDDKQNYYIFDSIPNKNLNANTSPNLLEKLRKIEKEGELKIEEELAKLKENAEKMEGGRGNVTYTVLKKYYVMTQQIFEY